MRAKPEPSKCGGDPGKARVLAFVDYFLPGYKGGGPIRTVSNMVEHLSGELEIRVVTKDRDLGDSVPYGRIRCGQWTQVGGSHVMYVRPSVLSIGTVVGLMNGTRYDVLYLNSFFSPLMTVLPLALQRLGVTRRVPVVLAPRGEFSPGALGLSPQAKRVFIFCAKVSRMYRGVIWQASTPEEAGHIRTTMGSVAERIIVATDLLPASAPPPAIRCPGRNGTATSLRVLFLSRISPKKNVDFLLRVLASVRCEVELSIVGPKEDAAYWARCEQLLKQLPPNVRVDVHGGVPNGNVASMLGEHHLLAFPTLGENFGHVIFEALSAGTPVLVSDRTPWTSDEAGALEAIPLEEELWRMAIERWSDLDELAHVGRRSAAHALAERHRSNGDALQQNRHLFAEALRSR